VLVEGGIMPSPCWVKRSSALHVGNIFGETDGFFLMYDCELMSLMNADKYINIDVSNAYGIWFPQPASHH